VRNHSDPLYDPFNPPVALGVAAALAAMGIPPVTHPGGQRLVLPGALTQPLMVVVMDLEEWHELGHPAAVWVTP